MTPVLSIVVATYRNAAGLRDLAKSVSRQSADQVELIVVANGANYAVDETLNDVRLSQVKVASLRTNRHFCHAINHGVSLSNAELIGVVNDDVTIDRDWASRVIEAFREYKGIGSVASIVRQRRDPAVLDSAGNHLSIDGCASNRQWGMPIALAPQADYAIFCPSNACAAYRRNAFLQAGGLDGDFAAYYEDIDLGFRMRLLGYESILRPECLAIHVGSATFRKRETAYLMERNFVWNLIKNLPSELWKRYRHSILARVRRPLPLGGLENLADWQRGKMAAMLRSRLMIRKRRDIQNSAVVGARYIERLLIAESTEICRL